MVAALPAPRRKLTGGRAWTWRWREPTARSPWAWCRIYHLSDHTPDAITHRPFGPLYRLDHHEPAGDGKPYDSTGVDQRTVLYVGGNLATAFGEVFGDLTEAAVCPNQRVSLVRPSKPLQLLDLRAEGAAMRLGALPSLAVGDYPRPRTQEWARAIYEDQPVAGKTVRGIYYDAAHTAGPAVVLWNTDGELEVVQDAKGRLQDFALTSSAMWPRIVDTAVKLGRTADRVASCPTCP